jgi:hypothetical protein
MVCEHLHYDSPANGSLHVLVPGKLLAIACPRDLEGGAVWSDAGDARRFSAAYYPDIFGDFGVRMVVRCGGRPYDTRALEAHGIVVEDLPIEAASSSSPSARPPTERATLPHLWQQQQAVAERREDDRRADDRRREEQRREDRREAAATAAAREARLEAVIANRSLLTAAPAATAGMVSTAGFKSSRSFEGVSVLSGDNGQSFRHRSAEFMAKAGIVGVEHDNLRDLRLKLTGPAREFYDRQWAVTSTDDS